MVIEEVNMTVTNSIAYGTIGFSIVFLMVAVWSFFGNLLSKYSTSEVPPLPRDESRRRTKECLTYSLVLAVIAVVVKSFLC
jgi:hypothetical protein